MDTALVITWKVPFGGREKQALDFGAAAQDYWSKLAAEGKCTAPEWYFMPEGWGMWIVKGERRVLDEILADDETERLLTTGLLLMDGWQYRLAQTDSGAERFMSDYATVGGQLGII